MMNFVVRLAPLGVFGAIAFTVGKYGIGSLKQPAASSPCSMAVAVFVVVVLGAVMRFSGFSLFKLLRYFREELTIVLGTAAGDSVLPQTMRKLELLGIKPSTVGLVISTGYSFNLDAFSIYLTLAAVFIAQATNTPLATGDLLAILGIALLTSKGAHGVPGSAIVVLRRRLQRFRPFQPSDWCCCCRWTGSSVSRARWATMSETALPRLPSPHGKAISIGKGASRPQWRGRRHRYRHIGRSRRYRCIRRAASDVLRPCISGSGTGHKGGSAGPDRR